MPKQYRKRSSVASRVQLSRARVSHALLISPPLAPHVTTLAALFLFILERRAKIGSLRVSRDYSATFPSLPWASSKHAQLETAREEVARAQWKLDSSTSSICIHAYKSTSARANIQVQLSYFDERLCFSKDILVVIIVRLWYNDSRLYNLFYIERDVVPSITRR